LETDERVGLVKGEMSKLGAVQRGNKLEAPLVLVRAVSKCSKQLRNDLL